MKGSIFIENAIPSGLPIDVEIQMLICEMLQECAIMEYETHLRNFPLVPVIKTKVVKDKNGGV